MKRIVAVFDFDGTLTKKDTFLEFIKYVYGVRRLYVGLLKHLPLLVIMKLGLYPNWKTKQRVFAFFFQGMSYDVFKQYGERFSIIADGFVRESVVQILENHIRKGSTVYVVSASIEDWVRPWCERHEVPNVLGTQVEVDGNGRLTGRFLSKNCFGQEKVNRLLEVEPIRDDYYLYAYGDSRGDQEMIAFADEGHKVYYEMS